MAEMRFIRFRISLFANTRIGTDLESTTINKTRKWSFLCFRVREHFPSTGILELLYADNSTFTGQMSGSGSNFCQRNNVTLRSSIILYETGMPFEGRVIGQSEFSFLIWLICAES